MNALEFIRLKYPKAVVADFNSFKDRFIGEEIFIPNKDKLCKVTNVMFDSGLCRVELDCETTVYLTELAFVNHIIVLDNHSYDYDIKLTKEAYELSLENRTLSIRGNLPEEERFTAILSVSHTKEN